MSNTVARELYAPTSKTGLRHTRRVAQVAFLGLWLVLFVLTRAELASVVPPDLFLMTDPLVAAITMGAAHVAVPAMASSLVLVLLTLVLGRVFCGWVCPLGTLIDLTAKVVKPGRLSPARHRSMQRWKYYILALVVVGAAFSAQWVYLLDPLVLLFRGMAGGVYSAVAGLLGPELLGEKLATSYAGVALAQVALLVVVLLLTAIAPRFYCRYLCPLGALYGLLSRRPFLRRRVTGCDACIGVGTEKQCASGCRMGAVPDEHPTRTQNHECIRCLSGRSFCHEEAIHFDWMVPKLDRKDVSLDLDRRTFVVWGATGAGLAPLVSLSAYHGSDPNRVIRPPRVLEEDDFVDQCVRCNMCVQACPTQTLQPTHLEAGVAGFWTPAISPVVGGCIATCNACSVACPTDAIPEFGKDEADKWVVKMGTAVLEAGRCISYAGDYLEACAKCIDICPTKAFVVQEEGARTPKRPVSVIFDRCVGCGLCELECAKIVFGTPAVLTFSHGRGAPTSLPQEPTPLYSPPHRPGE